MRKAGLSAAIGDVLNPGLLTVGSIANNTGFRACGAVDCGAKRTTVSSCDGNFPDKIRKTGRKRDAILTHHFRQRNRSVRARTRPGTFGRALSRLAGIVLFLAAPDPA